MEENKHYQIYIESILNLVGSIVLKSSAAAEGVNQMVYANVLAPYDEIDPTTWKYYQNICGIYYPSDTPMYITSMDTLEEILFSKEMLVHHRATARAYAFGTTYYKELVAKYPDQEQLIRGILYPADMTEAIEALDGQILSYPKHLVEDTEPSFIPMLQDWINGCLDRWSNPAYGSFDNLFNAGYLCVLYASMQGAIENIRMRLCRTNEAHSYHVREYLSSNSKLGQFLPYMTRRQAMYFYRNLRYIETNAGTNEVLDELIEKCMTERKLPIAHFNMLHSTEQMPDRLRPMAVFYKQPLNTPGNMDNRYYYTLSEIFDIEEPIALGNKKYRDDEEPAAEVLTENTLNPVIPTKLLQSTVIDYTDSERFRLVDTLLNHWLWLSHKEVYRAFVTFTIPANGMNMSLSAKDAFIFYAYALVKGYGLEMDKLPTVVANRVERLVRPTLQNLQQMVPKEMYEDARLPAFIASMPPTHPIISLEAFRTHCVELFHTANEQYYISAQEEAMNKRGYLEGAYSRLWADEYIYLGETPDQSYASWFADRNIVVNEYSQAQLAEIAQVIFKEAIGDNLASNITLKDIQNAMCSIILRLSSYSIQLDKDINTGPVIDVGQIQIRPDNLAQTGKGLHFLEIPIVEFENLLVKGEHLIEVNANPVVDMDVKHVYPTQHWTLEVPHVKFMETPLSVKSKYRMPIGVGMSTIMGPVPENPRGLTLVPGMEKFLALTLEQQLDSYVDTWA